MASKNCDNDDHEKDTIRKKPCKIMETVDLVSSEESEDEVKFIAVSRANSEARSVGIEDISKEPSKIDHKIKNLVPSALKSLIGKRPMTRDEFLLLILQFNADWLTDLQENQDPPIIAHDLQTVLNSYEFYEDYYNTMFPLMMLETWHRIYATSTDFVNKLPLFGYITSYTVKKQYTEVKCEAAYKSGMIFPHVGKIIVVRYTMKYTNQTIKVFGYVTEAKSTVQMGTIFDPHQFVWFTFLSVYHIEGINEHHPLDIKVLCSIDFNLKQNDALLFIKHCSLQRNIIDPVTNGFLCLSVSGEHSSEEDAKECVWNMLKNILSPNPAAITAVRTDTLFGHSKVIPLLVKAIKNDCKNVKILICVRYVPTLWKVANYLSLLKDLAFVIFHKCADTTSKFNKFTLDRMADSKEEKIKQIGDQKINKEKIVKIKKDILLSSDVVLSLIKCSHDKFLAETILEIKTTHKICCIIDEANYCTEPETLIPLLHEIGQLILIGDLEENVRLHSKTASAYNFNQSFFQRGYASDLINRSKQRWSRS